MRRISFISFVPFARNCSVFESQRFWTAYLSFAIARVDELGVDAAHVIQLAVLRLRVQGDDRGA